MPKGPNGERRPNNVISCAVMVAQIATGQIQEVKGKQPNKRRGGVKGGRSRAEALNPNQRHKIAKDAAQTRWH